LAIDEGNYIADAIGKLKDLAMGGGGGKVKKEEARRKRSSTFYNLKL
jgi:hypothetical protein